MNCSSPKVSVIIPIYNTEPYLRECLESAVNQTLRDIEIICVNDGSTDGSPAILNEYADKDRRIKIINQENKGAGAARNAGLQTAVGEYLSFLDSDDYFMNSMLEKAYKKAKKNDADIVAFKFKRLNMQTGKISRARWRYNKKYFPQRYPFSYKDAPEGIFKVFTNEAWNKIFKREFIAAKNIKFQEIKSCNDLFFVWCAIFNAAQIDIADKGLAVLRRGHLTNIQANNDKNTLDFYYAFCHLKEYLKSANKYEDIKQQFGNYFLDNALYNLSSLKDSGQFNCLYNKLKEEIFAEFSYDYSDAAYCSKLKEKDDIMTKTCVQYLFDKKNAIMAEMNAVYSSLFYRVWRRLKRVLR